MKCEDCNNYSFNRENVHKHRCDKLKMYFMTIEKALAQCPLKEKNERLPIGTKIYGFFGEREIIDVDDSDFCYMLNQTIAGIEWITSELKIHPSNLGPVAFTLENCPDIYKPKKKKVKKYRVRLSNNVSFSVMITDSYYLDKNDFYKDFKESKFIFLGLELETEKEFEE